MGEGLLSRFVAIDVEIASRSPLAVCAIAAVRVEAGKEIDAWQSLIRFEGRVKYSNIHGLTAADLRRAPCWSEAWRACLRILRGIDSVVAYRASFDRAALMTMCAQHGTRMPKLTFICAALAFESRLKKRATLAEALRDLELPFPGRPHDPLADARAAAALVLALDDAER